MSDIVKYEVQGRIALITLNRPEARNAVNGDVATGVEAAIDQMEADPSVWGGIITANTEGQERPVFCAGADLKAINSGNAAGLNTKRGGFAGFVYRERSKPVIVAVDGLATAGGCEIVLAADLVVATTRSSFGLAEVKRNLIAGAGGLFRLPRAIGQAAAMEAILTHAQQELVLLTRVRAGHLGIPMAVVLRRHRRRVLVPAIEVADDVHLVRVGCPHPETDHSVADDGAHSVHQTIFLYAARPAQGAGVPTHGSARTRRTVRTEVAIVASDPQAMSMGTMEAGNPLRTARFVRFHVA